MPESPIEYSTGVARYLSLMYPPQPDPQRLGFFTLLRPQAQRFVDVGAGDGALAFDLANAGRNVTAVEPDDEMRTVLMTRLGAAPALQPFFTVVPWAQPLMETGYTYSVVTCMAVLHHLLEHRHRMELLRALRRLCEPGGAVVIEEPVASSGRSVQPKTLLKELSVGDAVLRHASEREPLDPDTWVTRWTFETLVAGRVAEEVTHEYRWKAHPLQHLLAEVEAAGLKLQALHRDFAGTQFRETADTSVIMVLAP